MPIAVTTRRNFLRATAATAGLGAIASTARSRTNIPHANERISVALVGAGERGAVLAEWVNRLATAQNVALRGVCDIWTQRREQGADLIGQWTGARPTTYRTLGDLCQDDSIDAVVLATPDFQHAPQTKLAVEHGKHVYAEKPFGCDFAQIKAAREAVRASGKVVQLGTFRRSHGVPYAARDFVKMNGLGKVTCVEMSQPLFQQRWRIPGAEHSLTERDTDWKEFLSYTPEVPFDARRYREFRLFWPYSTGIFCQWMSHAIDMVNLVLDAPPLSVVATGGVYLWKDGRTNADTAHCLFEYPGDCLVSYHMRLGNSTNPQDLTFYGTKGALDLYAGLAYGNGGGGEVIRDRLPGHIPEFRIDGSSRLPDRNKGGVPIKGEPDTDHMVNFFECIRSGRTPNADIEAGYQHSLATTMAGMALRHGTKVHYDPDTETLYPQGSKPALDAAHGQPLETGPQRSSG